MGQMLLKTAATLQRPYRYTPHTALRHSTMSPSHRNGYLAASRLLNNNNILRMRQARGVSRAPWSQSGLARGSALLENCPVVGTFWGVSWFGADLRFAHDPCGLKQVDYTSCYHCDPLPGDLMLSR